MSLPDFREKQILFVNAGDVEIDKIKFANDNICLSKNGKIENQISCHKIFSLFIIGDCSLTSVLIRNCQNYGVSLFLLNKNFLNYARILSIAEGNYLLREKQYLMGGVKEFEIAKKLVENKISNQIFLLNKLEKQETGKFLSEIKNKIIFSETGKDLLGSEGSASKFFFQSYFESLGWKSRAPRAKIDIPNLLMDMGYTMLFNFIDAMLGIYGFDAYKGFYHKLFFQRKSLVCDILEPFRCIIDKQILKSYNLGQVNKKDFKLIKGRQQISYDDQNKYLEFFAQAIMAHKIEIFSYIRDFYYFVMNNSEFPFFKAE